MGEARGSRVTFSPPIFAAAIALAWLAACASTQTRNSSFLLYLGASTLVAVNLAIWGGNVGRTAALGVLGLSVVALFAPARFRLSSLNSADLAADHVLRSIERAIDDQGDPHAPRRLASALTEEPFADRSLWASSGLLYRLFLARSGDPAPDPDPPNLGTSPTWAYRRAGRHYWKRALLRRVLGSRRTATEWDEEVLLRCLSEWFDRFVPTAAYADTPVVPSGDWPAAAQAVIDNLATTDLVHPRTLRLRGLLVEARRSALALALGDRSPIGIERGNAAAANLLDQWAPLQKIGAVDDADPLPG